MKLNEFMNQLSQLNNEMQYGVENVSITKYNLIYQFEETSMNGINNINLIIDKELPQKLQIRYIDKNSIYNNKQIKFIKENLFKVEFNNNDLTQYTYGLVNDNDNYYQSLNDQVFNK